MRWTWLLVAAAGCRDAERPPPDPVTPPRVELPRPRVAADPLLAEALARAAPDMGIEKLEVWGVDANGTLDPDAGSIKVTWQRRPRATNEDLGPVDVPCVKLAWSQLDGWKRGPESTCTALGRPGLGFDRLGLPRCSIVEILQRLTVKRPPPGDLLLAYSPGLPYADGGKVSPGLGMWTLSVFEKGSFARVTPARSYDTCGVSVK